MEIGAVLFVVYLYENVFASNIPQRAKVGSQAQTPKFQLKASLEGRRQNVGPRSNLSGNKIREHCYGFSLLNLEFFKIYII